MALRLEIISQHRQGLGEIGIKEFGQNGGTIGRSLSNDWALPDRNRFLSARHAAIDYRSGSYYIVDTSTNGVYVNESDTPVGRGNPQRLFDGDRVRIGEYIIVARIDQDSTMEALSMEGHVDPVELAQRVESPDPTGYDLLDAHVMTGVGIEMKLEDSGKRNRNAATGATGATRVQTSTASTGRSRSLLMGSGPRPGPAQHTVPQPPMPAPTSVRPGSGSAAVRPAPTARPAAPQRVATQRPAAAMQPATARAPQPAAAQAARPAPAQQAPAAQAAAQQLTAQQLAARQAAAAQRATAHYAATPAPAQHAAAAPQASAAETDVALSAFFRGAGLPQQHLSEQECNAMLFLLGQLTRELLTGVAEALHVRAQQKTHLKLANTTIQKQDNNPLKFSASTSEALQNLLFKAARQYMGPVDAVRDAFADICGHQHALLKAISIAVPEYVNRLDPVVLEDKFARAGRSKLMAAATRIKHWQLYKDLFQVVAHHNPGQLPSQFLEELSRAYEEERQREVAVRKHEKAAGST